MATTTIDIPDELLALLQRSRLGRRAREAQVRVALAIHLLHEGLISVDRAAELAGEPRAGFELLLAELGIPPARLEEADYCGTSPAPGPAAPAVRALWCPPDRTE
jgi:predicted HTH domain antitoxin